MISRKVLDRLMSRAHIAEWAPFSVHVGIPSELAEMLFAGLSGSIAYSALTQQSGHRLISLCALFDCAAVTAIRADAFVGDSRVGFDNA
jgi:hypothetical protein